MFFSNKAVFELLPHYFFICVESRHDLFDGLDSLPFIFFMKCLPSYIKLTVARNHLSFSNPSAGFAFKHSYLGKKRAIVPDNNRDEIQRGFNLPLDEKFV